VGLDVEFAATAALGVHLAAVTDIPCPIVAREESQR